MDASRPAGFSTFPQMQGIHVESGISQFLRLCARRIASTKSPMKIAVLAHFCGYRSANTKWRLLGQ